MSIYSLVCFLTLLLPTHALYSKSDNVKLLTPTTWKTEVTNSKHVVLAEFFAPWCGHCKNLVPTYKQVADKTNGVVKVVAMDCDAHQSFCGQFGVKGFPTIKLFQSDKSKAPLEYQGARDAASLISFAVGKLISFVEKIKDIDGLSNFTDNKKIPKAILFSKKTSTPPLFKSLSVEYENRISFGEVAASNTELCNKFKVGSFPSVVLVKADGGIDDFILYEDLMKSAGLIKFFDQYAEKKKETSSEPKKEKKKERKPLDPKIPEINSQETYSTHCLSQSKTCLISILSPDASEDLKTLETLKKALYDSKDDDKFAISLTYNGKFIRKFHGASDALPGLIVVNHLRGWYRWFMGGFDDAGLAGLVADLKKGKGRNSKIDKEMLVIDDDAGKKEQGVHDEL